MDLMVGLSLENDPWSGSAFLLRLIRLCSVRLDTASDRLLRCQSWDSEFIVSLAVNPITGACYSCRSQQHKARNAI